jgi:hypothetical protein
MDNIYNIQNRVQKTNIKKDFLQAIGSVFGASNQPAATQLQYNMNMFQTPIENVSNISFMETRHEVVNNHFNFDDYHAKARQQDIMARNMRFKNQQ